MQKQGSTISKSTDKTKVSDNCKGANVMKTGVWR